MIFSMVHFTGVAGYTWVGVLHILLGFSFKTTLLIANATALGWLAVYYILLQPQVLPNPRDKFGRGSSVVPVVQL